MSDAITVIRPSAVLSQGVARQVLAQLEAHDVSKGGVWSATPGLWQRYDSPWNGLGGTHGDSRLLGSIGAIYGSPSKYDITIYRVTVTKHGADHGWTVDRLCDDALQYADLTLASCPRTVLEHDKPDPFHKD